MAIDLKEISGCCQTTMGDGNIVAICQYGGEFVSSSDGSMSYVGGEAHAVDIGHGMLIDDFKSELISMFDIDMSCMTIKYFLPNNRRTLITVSSDKDLRRMVDFTTNAGTAEVFILNKVENRVARSTVADSGTSIIAAAAAAVRSVKRKRPNFRDRPTKTRVLEADYGLPEGNLVGQMRPAALGNVNNCTTAIIADELVPVVATAVNAEDTVQHFLAAAHNVDDERAIANALADPNTPMVASLASLDDLRPLNVNAAWDDIITSVGQEFDNVKDFRAQLCKYAICKGFIYRFVKNETVRVTARCVDTSCPWRIHASESSRKHKFVIKKLNNLHTCGGGKEGQRRATRQWLTGILKEKLHSSPHCKPKEIVREIYEDYGVTLSYSQVWRGKEVAQKELYTMLKETYSHLPWFRDRILETNPGSVAILSTSLDSRFRFFVSFHASLHGFEHGCRPLLFLDRIPLRATNQCKLLCAAAVDGDDAVFPVSFAVVEDENLDSWVWFLSQLKYAVTASRTITFVSNRQKGLDEAVPHVFDDSHHGYCLRSLAEDLKAELKSGPWSQQAKDAVVDDFTRAAQACAVEDFNASIESIRSVSNEIADWVISTKPANWSDALFRGARYDHFSSNVVDSFNGWIPTKCESSVVLMVDAIRNKLSEVVRTRQEACEVWGDGMLTPSMEQKLQRETAKARKLNVLCSSETVFEVRGNTIYVVNIGSWECTCRRWQISGLPCVHAVAVFNRVDRSVYDYCSRYFRTDCYRLTYSASVHPIPDVGSLDFGPAAGLSIPVVRRTPTRPRRKRFNPNRTVTVVRLCSRCKQAGHNKATCEVLY